jgi:ProP effector
MTPKERQKREAAIRALAERWPKCFAVNEKRRRPLKVGIAEEIRAAGLDIDVKAALTSYAHNTSYLKALVAGAVRIGLDGEPAGTVTKEQEAVARLELAKRDKKQETKQDTKPKSEPAVAARRPILSLPSLRPKTKS